MTQILVITASKKKILTLAKYVGAKYSLYSDTSLLKKLIPVEYSYSGNGELTPCFACEAEQQKALTRLNNDVALFDEIIVAVDDSEQDALFAACLTQVLSLWKKRVHRIKIEEFNRTGIKKALSKLLPARVLYLEGYKTRLAIDYLIKNTIGASGTLQKLRIEHIIALGILCERADQVEKTMHKDSFKLKTTLTAPGGKELTCWLTKNAGKNVIIRNRNAARTLVANFKERDFSIIKVTRQSKEIPPPRPFTTDTLVQEAFRIYGIEPAKTLKAAKKLFTGVKTGKTGRKGLITFYLTGSDYTGPEAVAAAREYIFSNYGVDYLPQKAPAPKNKENVGEAIRPLEITMHPGKVRRQLSDRQHKIYTLIWNRFIAAHMSKAKITLTKVEIETRPDGCYQFQELETKIVFRGYKQVYNDVAVMEQSSLIALPAELRAGQIYNYKEAQPEKENPVITGHSSQADLWHILYTAGIPGNRNLHEVVGILFAHQLLAQHGHELHPTLAGHRLYRYAKSSFPDIFSSGFLKKVEAEIMSVENGQKEHTIVIDNFKKLFASRSIHGIDNSIAANGSTNMVLQHTQCPLCAGQLKGVSEGDKYYLVCENFKECGYKQESEAPKEERCPDCGARLVTREGRFGRFVACSQYPNCTFTKACSINVQCPVEGCDGEVVERRTKDGQLFYGCSHYPQCKFACWFKPVNKLCDTCGNLYLVIKTQDSVEYLTCPKCNSNWGAGATVEKDEIKMDN